MTWPATERCFPTAVPGGLGLVQDLLNTVPSCRPEEDDLLGDVTAAQAWVSVALPTWAERTGRASVRLTLTEEDLPRLRQLREQMRRALLARCGTTSGETARFTSCALQVNLHGDAALTTEPEGEGWRWLTSAILCEALLAQTTGEWRRLKICRNEQCGRAFYDRSRNNSGVWHSTRGCGNAANLRASRQRRRAGAESEPAPDTQA
ncbi:CGNR zinc finger domain-containing protein [Streptomyces sp. NBC_01283]|uniref:CGNR zinc finger domain-containing protein n=1 Tax=Streptomyces sp. NBC_01283 TaxID=2903812 RepID=UPI00352F1D41|nr:CGNR zinc finger domain-containing protein [Streptomyces sp. NBC_01283]